MNGQWRFPASNYGPRKGISTGDSETFKKSPFQAFAREILQNSIDARASDEEPTCVEFHTFELKTKDIPGCCELKAALKRCIAYWETKTEYVQKYKSMLDKLNQDRLICLRVSDYNTTGLIGVNSHEQKHNKFLALTKGTGVSEKTNAMAGGSKGVGKNTIFLMSSIQTAFYSTHANVDILDNPGSFYGTIGVADYVSGYIDDAPEIHRDYTQGEGYFSCDEYNSPLPDILSLDPSQTRDRKVQSGTDIFILGFLNDNEWVTDVINSILDSFMATVVRGELVVTVDNIEISKDTLGTIVYDSDLIYKNQRANIISQYRLLTDSEHVSTYDVDTEYGPCQLLVLPYGKAEEDLATHKCSMIRHPLMKIKDESLGASFRVSAMCIIGEGILGQALREIENPQHVDWETKRIEDKSQRKEIENILRDIREQIKDRVIECLQLGENTPLDPNGAGDFIPDTEVGEFNAESYGDRAPAEAVTISKQKQNVAIQRSKQQQGGEGTGLEPDIGGVDQELDGDVQFPNGENGGNGGDNHPGLEIGKLKKEKDGIVFRRSKLLSVKYKVISINRKEGKMRVIFTAPIDYDQCYLRIAMLDDANNAYGVDILSLKFNGSDVISQSKSEFGPFQIRTNEKVVLDIETSARGYFGSEVKVICK